MLIDRRAFVSRGIALGSLLALPRLSWAQGATAKDPAGRTLVLLHLNGGNDGLNTVIPHTDPWYRVLRPGIGIDDGRIRKIHERFGLHPALSGFEQLWKRDRLAIVNGVGYPNPNYSHFRATEIFYTAQPERSPEEGWLGRALDARSSERPVRAIALAKEKPLSLQCASPGIVTLTEFKQFQLPKDMQATVGMYEAYRDEAGERGAVARRALEAIDVARRIASLKSASSGFYGSLGRELGKVVALLRSDLDLEVIHFSFGGFDTHANQAATHNRLLTELGNNLNHYQAVLDRAGIADRVTTCVFSEFGRRAGENLSGGTDHGSAYPLFLIGKGVRPGIHGEYPSLEDLDNGNFKYTTDFRSVYATLLASVLRTDPGPVLGEYEPLELLA
jgi:uncharacterized protein (DUF1501 family)